MLTVGLITARPEFKPEWFFDSLRRCHGVEQVSQIIIVDKFAEAYDGWTESDVKASSRHILDCAKEFGRIVQRVPPKPNVWAGKYRLTPRDWWIAGTSRNTVLCHCRNPFLAFLDDRCALAPTWLDAVIEARDLGYAVCGVYEKVHNLIVKDGVIQSYVEPRNEKGEPTGKDSRMSDPTSQADPNRRRRCAGEWVFGCTFALPTAWMLNVNGVDESWSSVGMEDTHFGKMLENNGYPIYHDGRMKMVEDRTPREQDPTCREHDMKRDSKEKHPHDTNDKTHTLKRRLWNNKKAMHQWDMRQLRINTLNGHPFPIPEQPTHDWYDQQSLATMI